MCRRELDKSESEIKKNGSIIGEYKQVQAINLKYFLSANEGQSICRKPPFYIITSVSLVTGDLKSY